MADRIDRNYEIVLEHFGRMRQFEIVKVLEKETGKQFTRSHVSSMIRKMRRSGVITEPPDPRYQCATHANRNSYINFTDEPRKISLAPIPPPRS